MTTPRALAILIVAALLAAALPGGPAVAAPTLDASTALVVIDQPRGGVSGTTLTVSGWAADPASPADTGIESVEVYLDGEPDGGGTLLGRATYGLQRPDVAANLGSARFTPSGFALQAAVPPGPHTVYVYARTTDGGIAGGAPKTAAVQVREGLVAGGLPGEIPVWTQAPVSVTARIPGITGSYTFDVVNSSYYPPGPADIGGPIYAPVYYGYGFYGGILPFPDYPLHNSTYYTTGWLPSYWTGFYGPSYTYYSYDWPYSLGYGYDAQFYPNYYRRGVGPYQGATTYQPSLCALNLYWFC